MKLRCIYSTRDYFTVGKVYDATNGILVADDGYQFTAWSEEGKNVDDCNDWFGGLIKFELVEDKKVFTKKDLKNGDVVRFRNGKTGIVITDVNVIVTNDGWLRFGDYDSNLIKNGTCSLGDYDIVEVRRPTEPGECQFSAIEEHFGDLVYDRERDTVKEMTIGEIEKQLGYKIKVVKE